MKRVLRFFVCVALMFCVSAELCFARRDFSEDDVVVEFLDPMSLNMNQFRHFSLFDHLLRYLLRIGLFFYL